VRAVLTLADCDMSGRAKPQAGKTCFSQPLPRGETFEQVAREHAAREDCGHCSDRQEAGLDEIPQAACQEHREP
jgi:hypothetical protein